MNKELWRQTTDLSSFPLSHSILKNTVKKIPPNCRCIIQSMQQGINVHTKRTFSSLSFSFASYFLDDFCVLSLRCLFSLLHIFYPPSSPCFFFSSIATFSLSCWRVGPRRLVHKGTAHTQRNNSHKAAHAVVCRELLASRTEMYYCLSKDELPIQHEFNWRARVWWAAFLQECVRVCAGYHDPRRMQTDSDWVEIVVSQRQLLHGWQDCAIQRWNAVIVHSSSREMLLSTGLSMEYGVYLI